MIYKIYKLDSNEALCIFLGFIFIITIFTAVANYYSRKKEHFRRMDEAKTAIKTMFAEKSDERIVVFFTAYVRRRYDYIQVYFLNQTIGKVSDGLSLVLSIATLSIVATQTGVAWSSTIISVLAIVFVIISIYVAPIKRAKQYLEVWRECDKNITLLLSMDVNKKIVVCDERVMDINEFISYCANSLANGENGITTDAE